MDDNVNIRTHINNTINNELLEKVIHMTDN